MSDIATIKAELSAVEGDGTWRLAMSDIATIKAELETLATDCEDTAKEAMKLVRAETTAECAEARTWLSVAYRIRYAARRLP